MLIALLSHTQGALSHWLCYLGCQQRRQSEQSVHPCAQGNLTVALQDRFKHSRVGCCGSHSSERTNSILPNTPITGVLLQDRTWQVQVEILEGSCAVWLCWMCCPAAAHCKTGLRNTNLCSSLSSSCTSHVARDLRQVHTTAGNHVAFIKNRRCSCFGQSFYLLLVFFPFFGNTGPYLTQML